MTSAYAKHFSTRQTSQAEAIPGSAQVPNSAGGFSFPVDDWVRLDRFLVLGNEGGSYYASERKLTRENAAAVLRCLNSDPNRTLHRVVEISESGRAPKNDPAVFALALTFGHKVPGPMSKEWGSTIRQALPRVCRTGTHLFQFVEAVQNFRGWGRGLRSAVAGWYLTRGARELAYQVTKYQQRNGWTHRDLLRLSHVTKSDDVSDSGTYRSIFRWITKGWPDVGEEPHPNQALLPIWALEKAKRATSVTEVSRLIRDFRLVRECMPTNWLTSPEVWDALLQDMPLTALVRNLGVMTKVGLLAPMSEASSRVVAQLGDRERLRKSRVHPLVLLVALKTYASGHGDKGKSTWTPVPQVVDALDAAFYLAFDHVEPTGKRWYLGCDVSGSMWGSRIAGTSLTAAEGAAALALVTASVESSWYMAAFNTEMVPFSLTPRCRLDQALSHMRDIPWGGTDCAQPMLHALKHKIPVDVFVTLTDSETWAGGIHPTQALRQYRERMGIAAKMVTVAMVSNGFTIADPEDGGQMDVVGFDTSVPTLLADFARG